MSSRNKAEKFVELANKRVNRAIKDLQLIGNLANKRNYEFSDQQAQKIIRRLQAEVDMLKNNFRNSGGNDQEDFKL